MSLSFSDPSSLVWLVPLLPLLAGAVGVLLPLSMKRAAFVLALGALVASCAISITILVSQVGAVDAGAVAMRTIDFEWLRFGDQPLRLGFLVNPLTAVMIAMVTFVGSLIFLFSHGYMHEDGSYARFFSFLSLFCAGMLGLCVSNSLVLLFISWELVGVCSYLLIGFWFHKPSAAAAAKKAFLVTKLGDIGFFLGILWLYKQTGTTLLYADGAGILEEGALAAMKAAPGVFGMNLAGGLALLLFCGAVGKSGQFPLHVWLPDAMEGPTPVSALIHAATMVAAGVFLVGRTYPLFQAEPAALDVVAWLGAFTALLAATIAVAQSDIKRILAYSTVSQLGFMMLGLGTGGVAIGVFHLITHAFFKALLFLGAGSVIHGCHHEQDITKMGGLRKKMKVTFVTYVVGAGALAGVAPLAGFWSKDEILVSALHSGSEHGGVAYVPFAMALAASFLTAFYMTRQVALVFFGSARSDEASHAHESPAVMTLPLVVLALFAAVLGLVGTPWHNSFGAFVDGGLSPHHKGVAHEANIGFMVVATVIALGGIGLGWLLYGNASTSKNGDVRDPLRGVVPLYRALERRWYFDEIYATTVVRAVHVLGLLVAILDAVIDGVTVLVAKAAGLLSELSHWLDENVVRPGARGIGAMVQLGGRGLARVQSGRVQTYLSLITIAASMLVALWLLSLFGVSWMGGAP